ncbi:MAG: hypothetical protein F6J87_19655 [Spirulina sp. SIO3F2]|nr:hypothetical protein [Spirulina sp. SIO3F2]
MTIFNTINRPLTQWDDGQRWTTIAKLTSLYIGAAILTTTCNLTLSWDSIPQRLLRVIGTASACGLAALTLRENRDLVRMANITATRQTARTQAAKALANQDIEQLLTGLQQLTQPSTTPTFTPAPFPIGEFLDASTGICIMGNSGSAKTCVTKYLLDHINSPALVLDPHADQSHPEYPWGNLPVIGSKPAIFEQMERLMQLIEAKDRTPLTVVCEEWTSIYAYAKRQSRTMKRLAEDFIIAMATEGRKFNKRLILIGHADNVALYGLDGLSGLLHNFSLLRLGDIATRYCKTLENREIAQSVNATAYPLMWGDQQFLHPTHGAYTQRRKGQAPIGLATTKPLSTHTKTNPNNQPQPQFSVEPSNRSDQNLNLDVERLNRLLELDYEEPEPLEPFSLPVNPQVSQLPLNHRAELEKVIQAGWSKARVTKEFFGTNKGGGKPYKAACFWYEEVKVYLYWFFVLRARFPVFLHSLS